MVTQSSQYVSTNDPKPQQKELANVYYYRSCHPDFKEVYCLCEEFLPYPATCSLCDYCILYIHFSTYLSTNAKSIASVTLDVVRMMTLGNLECQQR